MNEMKGDIDRAGKMKPAVIDAVSFEVLRHKFWQTAEEMGVILIQASSSPVVTEVQDFATALFDARVRLIAERGEASFEVEHFRKDGTRFPLDAYVKAT